MTPSDVARLLAAAAAFDHRRIGEMDIHAWHKAIGHLEFADALEAVARYYRDNRDRIMPSDVNAGAKAVRAERDRATSEPLALPSRFEDDVLRDVRVKRGIGTCREVLRPIMARLEHKRREDADRRKAALDELLNPTAPESDQE